MRGVQGKGMFLNLLSASGQKNGSAARYAEYLDSYRPHGRGIDFIDVGARVRQCHDSGRRQRASDPPAGGTRGDRLGCLYRYIDRAHRAHRRGPSAMRSMRSIDVPI